MRLDALQSSIVAAEPATVRIATPYLDEEGNAVEIVLRDPGVAQMYLAIENVARHMKRRPLWPRSLCVNVLMLSVCHAEPAADNVDAAVAFYDALAESNPDLFTRCVDAMGRGFPWLMNLFAAAETERGE